MAPNSRLTKVAICTVALLFATQGFAAVAISESDNLTVIRMTVTPAAEPVPALKERLVVRDIDLRPGNAVPMYYRAILSLPQLMENLKKDHGEEFDKWYDVGAEGTPIDKLPLDRVRAADNAAFRSGIGEQLTVAATCRDCNWELGIDQLSGTEIISFLLPEFQQSRELSRLIALRTRLAIAEGRYSDAIASIRMNYRLGSDVARPPFLVCGLIGIAEASVGNGTLTELIAATNSPNMYWALAELPQPMIDLRPAARFEMAFGQRMFPFIRNAETADHSPAEWNRLFAESLRDLTKITDGKGFSVANDVGAGLAATGLALASYTHAKERLIDWGMDRDRVEQMAVGQVIAIYTERVYQRFGDDAEKSWYVPFWEAHKRAGEFEEEIKKVQMFGSGPDREILPLVSLLMPAIDATRQAQTRLDREIAALRTIEAIRMYAAKHDGKAPNSLDEITQVPVPMNPATGEPFVYRVDGGMAILELPASDGLRNAARRYEIEIVNKLK